ncbi:segregation and condensation protein A [Streptomyces sp. NPDC056817]|uniref:segregation and condensation protein A n=1 Tax=Streptomyces sp. NPDC056817 TaxID=3345950 RepID=UPI003688FE6B
MGPAAEPPADQAIGVAETAAAEPSGPTVPRTGSDTTAMPGAGDVSQPAVAGGSRAEARGALGPKADAGRRAEAVLEPGDVSESAVTVDSRAEARAASEAEADEGRRAEAVPGSGASARSAVAPDSRAESRVALGPAVDGGRRAEGAPGAEAAAGVGAEAGPPSEGAGDGVFKVRLANFEGPFDLLLQLISKHKLDVTEVALSKVTDEFMAHIRAMGPDWDLDQTTEFLVVAATLLDLKAARLLPAAEVEDEADLALLEARDLLFARLLQYRAYKQIADIFSRRLDEEGRRHPRTVGLEPHHAELLPEVVISIGAARFAELAVKAMQPKPKPQVYVDHIHAPLVSVREQAGIVIARLRELGEAGFRELVADTDDTLTVVARFLALLELYREKAVALDQETALGELIVRWTGGDGDETPMVTDEFDRPAEVPKEPEEPKEEKKA